MSRPMKSKPILLIVSVRGGVVQEVRTNHPVTVFVEDWDNEPHPQIGTIPPSPIFPGEEAELLTLSRRSRRQGGCL